MGYKNADQIAARFMDHAATAVQEKFGANNAGIFSPCVDGVGSIFIDMKPNPSGLLTPLSLEGDLNDNLQREMTSLLDMSNELTVVFCGITDDSLVVNVLTNAPPFTDEMMNKIEHTFTSKSANMPFGMTTGMVYSVASGRAITLENIDARHLREQAEFVAKALHDGITNPKIDL